MLSNESTRYIANIFIGDIDDFYSYKSGSNLVDFFNDFFGYSDEYKGGFPSRWTFVYDKIIDFINQNKIDAFLNIIIGKSFIMSDVGVNEVEAIELGVNILSNINHHIKKDGYYIIKNNGKFNLIKEDDDLEFIKNGGFAKVYRQKSSGRIIKKLKEELVIDNGIKSRFKREFSITKSLSDIPGIIKVYDFFEDNYSYSMEEAEITLYDYTINNNLSYEKQKKFILQILFIIRQVHERGIIHRDISPTNIMITKGNIKISDFGLGKDLNMIQSNQTLHTNAVGQYYYCAPEQFMFLKDGDKKSDVYSLGRVINFILCGSPNMSNHYLRAVTEKAISQSPSDRHKDAYELLKAVEKSIKYNEDDQKIQTVRKKIESGVIDEDVENYIYELDGVKLCNELLKTNKFMLILLSFIEGNDNRASHVLELISDNYRDVCGRVFEDYDTFASISYNILSDNFPFAIKERSAIILNHVAYVVNRFSAQHMVDELIESGIEPLIEEILK
ncbi:serine/threonine protein kinase [Clostridium estertheticum]|uniref:Serine/threonine protein kinase n=1 Tax=Clostridium estertheticum TaxID=238834 RepID=A0A5N7IPF5_9CLOT|nr:serine/threonine-protein kinase [Clostridium estertheticum]MPQ32190.1 serine/threonine protein kinase [Clostridium estertheticum]MPQ62850.1 serine/threonine protein kinase [Clostridium estertheticum]